jgi:hypothetical protein
MRVWKLFSQNDEMSPNLVALVTRVMRSPGILFIQNWRKKWPPEMVASCNLSRSHQRHCGGCYQQSMYVYMYICLYVCKYVKEKPFHRNNAKLIRIYFFIPPFYPTSKSMIIFRAIFIFHFCTLPITILNYTSHTGDF